MHYTLSLVDYSRVVIGGFFKNASPALFRSKAERANVGLAYKNVEASFWFVLRLERAVSELEQLWSVDDELSFRDPEEL